ncbi:hypothetical protein TRIUR3_01871 [Triticum urartu]|uniref:Uncharacterized protein n=1 Tax=Triticum urartu TaxID=4572 RepID=M7ZMY8_TRIUA|nr:hypothetical protein TRIUR3_01871 [Triticum urartu]
METLRVVMGEKGADADTPRAIAVHPAGDEFVCATAKGCRIVISTSHQWGAEITKLNVPADWREPGQRGVGDVRNAGEHRGSISIADGHGATDAHLYGDPNDAAIPTLLRSRFHGDKFDALNHLLALISQGVDVAHLSPQAVKNVVAQSLELKKLVSSTALPAPLRREV